jgi:hypothetical protein
MALIYLSIAAYLMIWISLLIHCVRRKEFYPILKNSIQTKIFWLITFLFFNPLLTVLYFIFGFIMKPAAPGKGLKLLRIGNVIALALVILIIVTMEIPFTAKSPEPIILTDDDIANKRTNQKGLRANLSVIRSMENFNSTHSSSHSNEAKIAAKNIFICVENPHPLLDEVARKLQLSLLSKPYINKVTYNPYKVCPASGELLPEMFISLDIDEIRDFHLPFFRKLKTTVITTVTNNAYSINYNSSRNPPLVYFNFDGTLDHKSTLWGYTTSAAKYKFQSEKIVEQIDEQLTGMLSKKIEEHGLMPDMPEYLYGKYHRPPQLEIIEQKEPEILFSGFGFMVNNQTVWRFNDDRKTEDILRECYEQLTAVGWKGYGRFDPESQYLKLDKGDAGLQIYRLKSRHSRTLVQNDTKPPMIVHYKSGFTHDQSIRAVEKIVSEEPDYQSLRFFQYLFNETNQRERWCELIEKFPPTSTEQYLFLAERYQKKDPGKAKTNLIYARAMEYAEDNSRSNEQRIKKLAEKLGDKSLAEIPVSAEILTQLGFIDIATMTTPVEFKQPIGRPLSFFNYENGELKTLTFRYDRQSDGAFSETIISRKPGTYSTSRGILPGGGSDGLGSHFDRIVDGNNNFEMKLRFEGSKVDETAAAPKTILRITIDKTT